MGIELRLKIYFDLRITSLPYYSLIVAHIAAHVPTDTVATRPLYARTCLIRVICILQCDVYGVVQNLLLNVCKNYVKRNYRTGHYVEHTDICSLPSFGYIYSRPISTNRSRDVHRCAGMSTGARCASSRFRTARLVCAIKHNTNRQFATFCAVSNAMPRSWKL